MISMRPGNIADYSAIKSLKDDVHLKHVNAEPTFYKASDGIFPIEKYLEEIKNGSVLVLENNGNVIGYAIIVTMIITDNPMIHDQKILFLDDICISENERRKGYGALFFSKIEEYGKANGYTSLELSVWDFNSDALRFYQKKVGMRKTRIRMFKPIK